MKHFVAGLGLGIVGGLLLAPKRGELLRSDVQREAKRRVSGLWNRASRSSGASTNKASIEFSAGSTEQMRKDSGAEVLNNTTRDALIAVPGIGPVLADRIIQNRPYERAHEVVERGILAESTFLQLRRDLLDKST